MAPRHPGASLWEPKSAGKSVTGGPTKPFAQNRGYRVPGRNRFSFFEGVDPLDRTVFGNCNVPQPSRGQINHNGTNATKSRAVPMTVTGNHMFSYLELKLFPSPTAAAYSSSPTTCRVSNWFKATGGVK